MRFVVRHCRAGRVFSCGVSGKISEQKTAGMNRNLLKQIFYCILHSLNAAGPTSVVDLSYTTLVKLEQP